MTRPARTQRCHQPHTIKLIDASIWPRQAKVIAGKIRFLFEVNACDEGPPPPWPASRREAFAVQRFQAALSAFTVIWNYLAVVAVVAWILFYLVH